MSAKTFVRVPTLATKDVAKRNFRLAKERYERGKEMLLSGVALHCYVIGLQGKDGAESNRSLIVYSLLVSGIGSYALSDIARVTDLRHKDGSALTQDGKIAAIRTALQSYIVPRAFESQPFFPYTFEYNRRDATVRVLSCEGAKDAREALLAPKTRKERDATIPALPSPSNSEVA
jgi:hypothetical protein